MAAHRMLQTGHFAISQPALLPIPPTPSISNTDGRKGQQKYHEIQPSEMEIVGYYNKNQ